MAKQAVKNNILTGVIYKQILLFFFPILIGSLLQQLYNTADAVIVGKFVHKEGLAAIGATTYITNILIGFFIGLSAGATVIISQFYGAGKTKNLKKAVHTAIALAILCGVIVMILGILFSPLILSAMNTPPEIFEYALLYLRVYFAGSVVIILYNVGAGILMAVGDSKSPLYVLIVCTICNIVLDLFFVAVLRLGVFGAGLATLLSQFVSAALVLLMLIRADAPYRLTLKKIAFHKSVLGAILRIGLPTGFQSTMYFLSNIIIQSSVNTFGTDTIAAWTAFTRIDNFFWVVIGAFGVSITTFAGQNFGAAQFDRMKKGIRITSLFSAIFSLSLSLLFYLWCAPLLSLFTPDKKVIEIGVMMFRHFCQYYIFFVPIEILSSAIRGTGDSYIPTLITAIGICLLRILWIFIAVPLRPTMETILFSYPLTWFITAAAFLIYYLHGGWLKRRKQAMGF